MSHPVKAVILAAGRGERLRPLTDDRPKCLVELAGQPLLLRQKAALNKAGIENITVVTGYRADLIEALGFQTVNNPRYAQTNMVASLMCAASLFDGGADVLICYGDIVYQPPIIRALLAAEGGLATAVDANWLSLWRLRADDPLADAETLRIDAEGHIRELGRKPKSLQEIEGQYMGLIKVARASAPAFADAYKILDPGGTYEGRSKDNMFMTAFLQHLIDTGHPLRAVMVQGGWLEVDSVKDLDTYHALQAQGRLKEFYEIIP